MGKDRIGQMETKWTGKETGGQGKVGGVASVLEVRMYLTGKERKITIN